MHAIRVASAALLSVTALTFLAPVAVADDGDDHNVTPFGFGVQPSTISAGGRVGLLLNNDGGARAAPRSPRASSTPSPSGRVSPRPRPRSTGTQNRVPCTR